MCGVISMKMRVSSNELFSTFVLAVGYYRCQGIIICAGVCV